MEWEMHRGVKERIKNKLWEKQMTVKQLASKARITDSALESFMNEKRVLHGPAIARIAETLDTTVDYILGMENGTSDADQPRSNADVIREMPDEELVKFLWWYKIDAICSFLKHGGKGMMEAEQLGEWLRGSDRTEITRLMHMGEDVPDSN